MTVPSMSHETGICYPTMRMVKLKGKDSKLGLEPKNEILISN